MHRSCGRSISGNESLVAIDQLQSVGDTGQTVRSHHCSEDIHGTVPAAPPQGTSRTVTGRPMLVGPHRHPAVVCPSFPEGPIRGTGLKEEVPPHVSLGQLPSMATSRSHWRWDNPVKGRVRGT